jgi:hypothetical protein
MHYRLCTNSSNRLYASGDSNTTYGSVSELISQYASLTNPINRSNVDRDLIETNVRVSNQLGKGSAGIVWKVRYIYIYIHIFGK